LVEVRARTREALMRLKAQGKQLGRPRKVNENIAKVLGYCGFIARLEF